VRRILILAAAIAAVAPATPGLAHAHASSATLQLRKTSVGTILVDARGFTLYAFTRDGRGKDVCATIGGCLSVWPLVSTGGHAIAGRGIASSLIGSIARKGGARQITYAGHPLYTYSADSGPGQTSYVNVSQFGGRWPALNGVGQEVK
jgi:predicted lipoprotein with Yx(FWY)xxD motif